MASDSLIRVGSKVINLDNVMAIDLDYVHTEGSSCVVVEFAMRGSDELDEGQNIASPYMQFFDDEEAAAIRRYFEKACPDLLEK